jgi:DNA (cytosine-5)-methyltransferase 1
MNVNSFFCGAGGFDIGFVEAGFTIEQAYDFNEHAVKSYRHNLGNHVQMADVSKMVGSDLRYADIWTYGFPCQDLTKNGARAGINGSRSGMFFEIMRLLGEVEERPKIILAENVRGLSKYFDVLEAEHAAKGYRMYKVLYNSKFWGVPQNRERYFVLGVRDDLKGDFEFPVQGTEITAKLSDVIEDGITDRWDSPLVSMVDGELRVRQATKKGYDVANIGDSINVEHVQSKTRRGRVGRQIAQTLLTSCHQLIVLEDYSTRKFTPREYARIQSFPDSFEQVVSDSQFYKQIGNAVSPKVAYVIAEHIGKFLTNS